MEGREGVRDKEKEAKRVNGTLNTRECIERLKRYGRRTGHSTDSQHTDRRAKVVCALFHSVLPYWIRSTTGARFPFALVCGLHR
jgi:hypothetical protein